MVLDRRGQFRIIEALISVAIIVSFLTASMVIQRIPRSWVSAMRGDLEEMAFNVLVEVADLGLFDSVKTRGWELRTYLILKTLLPPSIYFNLTVYEVVLTSKYSARLEPVNMRPISNIVGESVSRIAESASACYVHTSSNGSAYLAVLTLASSRGG